MMTKTQLQEILSTPFELETWRDTLAEIFKVKKFHQQPQPIILPSNDKAENAYELGSFETEDDRLIGLYQVNVLPGLMLERNKVGLRGLLRNVYKYDVDGALIVFVQGDNWRFSYVSEIRTLDEKGYVTQTITNPKRYTYFFGTGESCRTAVERFQLLSDNGQINLKDIQEAFSVEKISKQFFKEYKEHYSKFVDYLDGSKYKITALNNDEKAIRNFCKKLLGRIVFLYFLQKKGWLGVPLNGKWGEGDRAFLRNLFLGTGANQSFYAAALTTLFFDTLNTIREKDICELIDGKPCRIPYLNGGLFEKESYKYDFLTFPPQLFTDLFAFFDSYNFTIYEDSPEEHTMAVDPEMLGHIFENLLEDNKDKGAYYTPKEIVHYMTQESLIEYLFTHCQNSDISDKMMDSDLLMDRIAIENLVKNKETTDITVKQAKHLDQLLDNVKICDPAIGSGAFPMGLLHEIYSAKQLLFNCHSGSRISGAKESPDWNPARVKENIIQNSIYGVDIEKGAVNIARLRFWLSLIVDEDTPRPLPNLEYKIVVGNSLVPKFEDEVIEIDWDLKSSVGKADEYVQKIQALLKQIVSKQRAYFNPGGDKQKQKQEIRDLKIELLITQLTLNKYRYQAKNPLSSSFAPTAKDRQRDLEIKTTISGFERNIAKLKTLQGNDKPFEHFDWKLDFPDVMNENVTKEVGFDIVIANPPYVEAKKLKHISLLLKKYKVYSGTADLSSYFFEIGINLSKINGLLCLINTNKFFNTGYGKSVRTLIIENEIKQLLNFEQVEVFEGILVSSVIISVKKISPKANNEFPYKKFYKLKNSEFMKTFIDAIENRDSYLQEYLTEKEWSFADTSNLALKNKIEFNSIILKNIDGVNVCRGVTTGYNPAFIIDEKTKQNLILRESKNAELIKPLLQGRNIRKWVYNKSNFYLLQTGYDIDIPSRYPKIMIHLRKFEELLIKRTDQGKNWWNLRACKYYNKFEKEKIIWGLTADKWAFAYDNDKHYLPSNGYILTSECELRIKYILAILNSKLMEFYFEFIGIMTAGGAFTLKHSTILELPFKIASNQNAFIQRVDEILESKSQGKDATVFEQQIDLMVYKLYQLTYDEVLVVDPAFPLSKEEYENYNGLD